VAAILGIAAALAALAAGLTAALLAWRWRGRHRLPRKAVCDGSWSGSAKGALAPRTDSGDATGARPRCGPRDPALADPRARQTRAVRASVLVFPAGSAPPALGREVLHASSLVY